VTALAALPASGRCGRPPCCTPEVVEYIFNLRRAGLSLQQISDNLNDEGIATPASRSQWTKSHVDRLLHTQHVQDLLVLR